MEHENKRWKRIMGGVFLVLGVGIYALYFLLIAWLRKMAVAEKFDPALVNVITAAGIGVIFMANWPSILLLGFGIAWWWNSKPMVRVWCYRVLMVFFLGVAGLVLVWLFWASQRKVTLSWKLDAVVFWYFVAGLLFYWRSRKLAKKIKAPGSAAGAKPVGPRPVPVPTTAVTTKARRRVNYSSCNVLRVDPEARHLWQFEAHKGGFRLGHKHTVNVGDSLPANVVNRSWSSIWQPKLNVAWLPLESVFLRVVQLPKSTLEETLSMVELQLEKLSPIPVTQVVWSLQPLTRAADGLQTLIIIFAERKAVEEYLGNLEGHGFLADRLELPVLDQLLATQVTEDGAWIYPGAWSGTNTALVAWWYGGVLQNINFVSMPTEGDRDAALKQQLSQTTWAGELEGWMTSPPTWHLVADETIAAEWEPPLRQGLEEPVAVSAPLSAAELAALTANRATRPEAKSNLLPPEFSRRYQQQFVDRLWIHGLFAAGLVYAACVLVYFAVVGVVAIQARSAEKQVAELSVPYTNAILLKARYDVLKDRQELKFAALECWKAVAELLPETLSVDGFNFNDGKRLTLNGTAPKDDVLRISDFYSGLRKATVEGQPLFSTAGDQSPNTRLNPGAAVVNWNFSLELKRVVTR